MQIIARTVLALALLTVAVSPVLAAGGGGGNNSRLTPFQKLIDEQKYQQAIDELDKALAKSPDDADLLNLAAFSHRKLEQFDTALEYYTKALKIEPEHRGANEYLGELYLRLGKLDKAEERLTVLDDACFFGCEEYDELKQAIEAYRQQHPS
ncbi:MAG: tetratricopeptide repeat protein [Gammaproteobacteria bacterium]|jgi:tetratricopeptide (TPR) repeat protein